MRIEQAGSVIITMREREREREREKIEKIDEQKSKHNNVELVCLVQ